MAYQEVQNLLVRRKLIMIPTVVLTVPLERNISLNMEWETNSF